MTDKNKETIFGELSDLLEEYWHSSPTGYWAKPFYDMLIKIYDNWDGLVAPADDNDYIYDEDEDF